ncbi:MAG: SPFH domain-containing protein, partial [Marmoricola sp.]
DKVRMVDTREQKGRLAAVPLVTRDEHPMSADVNLCYRVVDPRAATYEVADYALGIEQLARSALRRQERGGGRRAPGAQR